MQFILTKFLNRNLDVAEDDGVGKVADENEDDEDIIPGLQCKIVVRFEDHKEFSKALKVLCGRSLQKVDMHFQFFLCYIFFITRCYNGKCNSVSSYLIKGIFTMQLGHYN